MHKNNLTLDDIKKALEQKRIEAELVGVEYKQNWRQEHGKDISAIANHPQVVTGWLLIGVNDKAEITGGDINWAKKTEEQVSTHIQQFLDPTWAIKSITVQDIKGKYIVAVEIIKPDDVTYWNERAYKLIGSTSHEMKPDEILSLSLTLPGADYSKSISKGEIDTSLVMSFAQKLNEIGVEDFNFNLQSITSADILNKLNIISTNVATILFGDVSFRFVHFNESGDILDQKELKGLYRILQDSFVEEIQSWTRRQGTIVGTGSVTAPEEQPYPPKAIREVLANAVAHALYQRNGGDIVIELHPDRMTARNNCYLEANAFVNKWLSRYHKTYHKHLMNTLRTVKVTDEQGSGKIRIFKHMIESGKREPIVDFEDLKEYGRWSITLYNDEANLALKNLYTRLIEIYNSPDKARVAQALLLWRNKNWSEILSFFDENYRYLASQVIEHTDSPIILDGDKIFTRRWAQIALDGQVTKEFTEAEKSRYLHLLNRMSFKSERGGFISSEDAKMMIGLSNTKQESAQIGKLFDGWKKKGIVEKIKKGQWQFIKPPTE